MVRILLPTDFSDNSFQAIQYALKLYKEAECTFFLLHTYTPAVYQTEYLLGSPGQIGLGDVLQESSMSQLEELKRKLDNKNPKHHFIVHSAFNTLVGEISVMIDAENIDLIVMGTQGATGLQEILLGTNTVHVIKQAKCPVIAVPPNFEYEAPKEILFPTDYEISYDMERMEPLLALVQKYNSRINVLHVRASYELNPLQEKNKAQLEGLLKDTALFHEVPDSEIITAINQFQDKNRTNLLVMMQNKHSFIERMFLEPVIKKIGFHITIPFMVFPPL
ncbi:universal stress protein [Arenibacter lacus]|uniref:universal stress protein n=1 Tax=Arenibacter lacus TaxID=2608629 RepID=UPI00123D7CEA|nr:universal stress protein [Arenibacter lacus]